MHGGWAATGKVGRKRVGGVSVARNVCTVQRRAGVAQRRERYRMENVSPYAWQTYARRVGSAHHVGKTNTQCHVIHLFLGRSKVVRSLPVSGTNTNILSSSWCQKSSVTNKSSLSAMAQAPPAFPHAAGAENLLGTKLLCHHLYLSRWGRRLWGSRHRSYQSRYWRSYRWRYRWCWGCGRQCQLHLLSRGPQ
jgi:hypothetical protein